MNKTIRSVLLWSALLSALAAAWWLLAPTVVGGRATYVVTHGISMEPAYHTGDLAIVLPDEEYRVGEVVAYHSRLLHTMVLHRIIGVSADGFVMQGDNNAWRDPEHPGDDEIAGRLLLHVPRGGRVLDLLHRPGVAAVAALMIAALAGYHPVRSRRRPRGRHSGGPSMLDALTPTRRRHFLAGAGLVAAAAVATSAIAFAAPAQVSATESVPVVQKVTYHYAASVPRSTVYPTGTVSTGEPVFRRIVDRLRVHAAWSLQSTASHHVRGSGRLVAVLRSDAGWSYRTGLGPTRPVTGDTARLGGVLDLRALDAIAARNARLTGIPATGYTVEVRPVMDLHGTIAGKRVPTGTPLTPLTLTVTEATAVPSNGTATSTAPGAGSQAAPAPASTATSAVTRARMVPAHVTLGPARLRLTAVRMLSGVVAVLAVIAALALVATRRASGDERREIASRYRRLILPVDAVAGGSATTVQVSTFAALAQVAQRYDRLILNPRAEPTAYVVEDDGTLYRFDLAPHRA